MAGIIDGIKTLQILQAKTTNTPGYCAETDWEAAKASAPGIVGDRVYPNAYAVWQGAQKKHPGDRNPPAGVPVFLGPSPTRTDANKNAGDQGWSLGGGLIRVTDYPRNGVMGTCTIAQREAQTERPYLGWTEDLCGVPISFPAAAPATATATTTAPKEDDVSYSIMKDANSATEFCCSLNTGLRVGIGSTYHVTLLQRYKAGDTMLLQEMDIVSSYIKAVNPPQAAVNVDATAVANPVIAAIKALAGKVTFS